jgi:ABC-2 type transport system ATP-binding protein
LWKDYGVIRALRGVSFTVQKGEVVGFLGPNGACKTTCMKILTGFISATSGTVTVDGLDVVTHGVEVRKRIGYLPENAPLYGDMTVREYLAFVARLRGVDPARTPARIEEVAGTTGIRGVLGQEIGTLSKGYRQRTGLAQALIHNPEILILDEPTSGLDPNQIVEVRSLVKEIGKDRTVILSTHNLPEVTATCNRIIVVHRGTLVADGTPQQIQERHAGGNTFLIEIARKEGVTDSSLTSDLARLQHVRTVTPAGRPGNESALLRVEASDDSDLRPILFDCCVKSGWTLMELRRERLDLEAIFQRITLQ